MAGCQLRDCTVSQAQRIIEDTIDEMLGGRRYRRMKVILLEDVNLWKKVSSKCKRCIRKKSVNSEEIGVEANSKTLNDLKLQNKTCR